MGIRRGKWQRHGKQEMEKKTRKNNVEEEGNYRKLDRGRQERLDVMLRKSREVKLKERFADGR